MNMPREIYNCGVVLTRLYVTKDGIFNKQEVFFTTHVEGKVDVLITRGISGTISRRSCIPGVMGLLAGEGSDTLSERTPVLCQLRIDGPCLLDQLTVQLFMGFDSKSLVVLLGQGQAGPAQFSYFIPVP